MAKARGKVEEVDLLQVSGLDSRIWQKDGSSTDNSGIVYSLRGEVAKVRGIQPLLQWALPKARTDDAGAGGGSATGPVWPFYDPATGELFPLMSIGAFNMNGAVEILLEYGGKIGVVRGSTVEVIAEGRRVAERSSEGTQFLQVGGAVLILNGFDGNLKWDGKKVTPLGIQSPPSAPVCVGWSDGFEPAEVVLGNVNTDYLYPGQYIEKVDGDLENSYQYKMTWVNDQGAESEDSAASTKIVDKNVIPSAAIDRGFVVPVGNLGQSPGREDIVGRRLYRAGFEAQQYYLLADLPGTESDSYIDTTEVTYTSSVVLPAPNTRLPPPVAKFAIYFRERTFYAGNPAAPQSLYYSLGLGLKESVPQPGNIIQIATEDGSDHITAMCVVSDYALVFTKRSIHMLTMTKDQQPILTPISQTIGCVGNRAVVVFENKVFFFSQEGLFAFDGSSPQALSSELNQQVRSLPKAFLPDVVAFVSPEERRVCFSVCEGPTSENNKVWAVHIDTGAISKIGVSVLAALRYKDETLVSFAIDHFGQIRYVPDHTNPLSWTLIQANFRLTDLGMWGCLNSLAERQSIDGYFDTRWLIGKNPEADKTFHRMDLFYVQTGDYPLDLSWSVDWKQGAVGRTTIPMAAPDAVVWDKDNFWNDGSQLWDERRVRSVRLDMSTLGTAPGGALTAKAIKFRFGVDGRPTSSDLVLDRCWRLVGFVLFYSDHGIRAEGTDVEGP